MYKIIRNEYEKTVQKKDELRESLKRLETDEPKDTYNIMITRDRLAYWEGKSEGLKFALDQLKMKKNIE
ncbi:MAG: hypothetical protein KAQ85_11510 [Thermodesulfovibrionia bacterium]|nr:hypothetical protein [Thermodesulfovibrionia bacterium]